MPYLASSRASSGPSLSPASESDQPTPRGTSARTGGTAAAPELEQDSGSGSGQGPASAQRAGAPPASGRGRAATQAPSSAALPQSELAASQPSPALSEDPTAVLTDAACPALHAEPDAAVPGSTGPAHGAGDLLACPLLPREPSGAPPEAGVPAPLAGGRPKLGSTPGAAALQAARWPAGGLRAAGSAPLPAAWRGGPSLRNAPASQVASPRPAPAAGRATAVRTSPSCSAARHRGTAVHAAACPAGAHWGACLSNMPPGSAGAAPPPLRVGAAVCCSSCGCCGCAATSRTPVCSSCSCCSCPPPCTPLLGASCVSKSPYHKATPEMQLHTRRELDARAHGLQMRFAKEKAHGHYWFAAVHAALPVLIIIALVEPQADTLLAGLLNSTSS